MNVRLAYRASHYIKAPHENVLRAIEAGGAVIDRRRLSRDLNALSDAINASNHICLDNVAEFYATSENQFETFSCIPNWAPPFNVGFYEWNEPFVWNLRGNMTRREGGWVQSGLLVTALDVSQEHKENPSQVIHAMRGYCGTQDPRFRHAFDEKLIAEALSSSRWVLSCECITSGDNTSGAAVWCGVNGFLFVSEDGHLVTQMTTGILGMAIGPAGLEAFTNAWKILGLGSSFMHCKNVSVSEGDLSPGRRWHSNSKVPRLVFKTLVLSPGSPSTRNTDRPPGDYSGYGKAFHICRGHFATYTEANPLFGKYTGTFWRPDHTRGTLDVGVVQKDYSIEPEGDSV